MKLFLRDHIGFLLLQPLQWGLVLAVFMLDGYRDIRTGLYAVFLGTFVMAAYLAVRYLRHRAYYRLLARPLTQLDAALQDLGSAPVPEVFTERMREQYRVYADRQRQEEERRQEHLQFIHQWVHQMKTPLSVIHLTVQGQETEQAASLREEAERLDRGLELVMYAARLERFEQDLVVAPASLRELAGQVIQEHKRLFIQNGVYPDNQVDPDVRVETDSKWLRFVLGQIVGNAIKYASGTGSKITLATHQQGDDLFIEIRDRGVGIPDTDLQRVFQPFFTGENGRAFRESTGMGLYLADQICRRLQHRLELESQVGQGTVVRIAFHHGRGEKLTTV